MCVSLKPAVFSSFSKFDGAGVFSSHSSKKHQLASISIKHIVVQMITIVFLSRHVVVEAKMYGLVGTCVISSGALKIVFGEEWEVFSYFTRDGLVARN